MLARRELSEAQLRQRLARREHDQDSIDEAVARLTADRSLDDARAAGAIARSEAALRGRGRMRVKRRLEAAGIAGPLVRQAVDDVFRDVDVEALIEAALQRRLRGAAQIADERQYARLYRYLLGQGFEADRIAAVLRRYRP
jgi:regulatory protein